MTRQPGVIGRVIPSVGCPPRWRPDIKAGAFGQTSSEKRATTRAAVSSPMVSVSGVNPGRSEEHDRRVQPASGLSRRCGRLGEVKDEILAQRPLERLAVEVEQRRSIRPRTESVMPCTVADSSAP